MYQPAATTFDVPPDVELALAAHSRAKRAMDIGISASLLLFLLPMLLLIFFAVRLESRGPVLFRQRRGGAGGRPFMVYKVRTMTVAEDGDCVYQAQRVDCRVTNVGAFLRKTSLDELPQLLNVLRGDMSMVGPRPHAIAHDHEFQRRVPLYNRRFAVRPGITGLAQLRGFRGETLHVSDIAQRVASDIEYIDTWNVGTDLRLLVMTLKVPFDAKGY